VQSLGGRPWTTLTCRDRNRIVLEQELAGLAALGLEGVLCVTGDAEGTGCAAGVTQVFDLDGIRLAVLAANTGLVASVAEAPPATEARPHRVLEKEPAGARLCLLNHVSSAGTVSHFVERARAAGVTLPFIAGVAVHTDERSAAVLQAFPGCTWIRWWLRECWTRLTRSVRASRLQWRKRGACCGFRG
jgi:methylenetetrahydrofolate reductase (NADPH)